MELSDTASLVVLIVAVTFAVGGIISGLRLIGWLSSWLMRRLGL